jgi:hypothetical protein
VMCFACIPDPAPENFHGRTGNFTDSAACHFGIQYSRKL